MRKYKQLVQSCDICSAEAELSIVASSLAPVTVATCSNCEARGAENIGVVSLWLASFGGPSKAPDFSKDLVSFVAGEYAKWTAIQQYYLENEGAIIRSFKEEFSMS